MISRWTYDQSVKLRLDSSQPLKSSALFLQEPEALVRLCHNSRQVLQRRLPYHLKGCRRQHQRRPQVNQQVSLESFRLHPNRLDLAAPLDPEQHRAMCSKLHLLVRDLQVLLPLAMLTTVSSCRKGSYLSLLSRSKPRQHLNRLRHLRNHHPDTLHHRHRRLPKITLRPYKVAIRVRLQQPPSHPAYPEHRPMATLPPSNQELRVRLLGAPQLWRTAIIRGTLLLWQPSTGYKGVHIHQRCRPRTPD